jgi:hypothetical protein
VDTDGPSFCVLPWIHFNVNPDGVATLCCQSHHRVHDNEGRELNLQSHSMQEIWNAEGMKDIRRRMSSGEWLPHCQACFNNERYGRTSYRQHSNERWLHNHPRAAAIREMIQQSVDGTTQMPVYFDLRLGNILQPEVHRLQAAIQFADRA